MRAGAVDATVETQAAELKFRDPGKARALTRAMERACEEIGRERISVMHVCGSHEQSIAKYGLRTILPQKLNVIMGPGCPVCVTDVPEVDEAVALALDGARIATYGDMLKVPGSAMSLAEAEARGGRVEVVYSASRAVDLAVAHPDDEVVFFASGFETTAVATAAVALRDPPPNFSILSAHKYIPPVMEIVAEMPESRVEGYLAAGHAATITGSAIFEAFVERHGIPVVVAGFEPLDVLAGLLKLVEAIRDEDPAVHNMYPRCVTPEGNRNAQDQLWAVFEPTGGVWRGIAHVPNGNLRLRDAFADLDARRRFDIDLERVWGSSTVPLTQACVCGDIMAGIAAPTDCELFDRECTPSAPVGACMVSNEGTCKIWHQYGGHPDL